MENDNTKIRSVTQEQSDKWDNVLDEYEDKLGLPQFKKVNKQEISQYMQMSRSELEKLSPEDCAQIAYMLITYGVFIQKIYNREIARAKWALSIINQSIADNVGSYGKYAPYEERRQQAIKHNDHAQKLYKIHVHSQGRADRLLFLSTGIKNTADIMLNLQRAKTGVKQNVG